MEGWKYDNFLINYTNLLEKNIKKDLGRLINTVVGIETIDQADDDNI